MRRPHLLVSIAILAWCVVAYRGLLDHPWSYDDDDHILKARKVLESPATLWDPDSKEPSRVVHHLYVLFVYVLFGESVHAFHFLNVVLHLLNAWLCYLLTRRLVGNDTVALAAAFLFVVNTVAFEAIYWIAASATLMGAAFAQTAAILALRSGGPRDTALAALAFLGCGLSYESHIPVLLPIAYLAWARPHRISARIPAGCAVAAIALALLDVFVFDTADVKTAANEIDIGLHAIPHLFRFVGRLFVNGYISPAGWSGTVPFDMPPDSYGAYTVTGAVLIVGVVAIAFRFRSTATAVLLVWVLPAALPSSLSSSPRLFPRYWYLPAVASSTLSAMGVWYLIGRLQDHRIRLTVVGAAAVVLLWISLGKSRAYEGRYLVNTANYHRDHRQDPQTAIPLYRRARADYGISEGHLQSSLAMAHGMVGDWQNVAVSLRSIVDVDPAYAVGLAEKLAVDGKERLAMSLLSELLEQDAWRAEAAVTGGGIALRRGNLEEARQFYSIAIDAGSAAGYTGMSLVASRQGHVDEALRTIEQAVRLSPEDPDVLSVKGQILSVAGRNGEAIETFERAVALAPEDGDAHYNLGTALLSSGQIDQAIDAFETSLTLTPDREDLLVNAAVSHRTAGNHARARELFHRLLEIAPDHDQASTIRGWLSDPDSVSR